MASSKVLLTPKLVGWRMSGEGGFYHLGPGEPFQSFGGPGLLWYAAEAFSDFVLYVEWRTTRPEDNSGVFMRCPPLDGDIRPAIENGYEIQIDERGLDTATGKTDSPLHMTGAIYRRAPAIARATRPDGAWNLFEITVRGTDITVVLNGVEVSRLEGGVREPRGHIALQAHHQGSTVQFRRVDITTL